MSDNPFYQPNRLPPPPPQPKPGERIWETRVDHVTWSCELRFHGESYGWEAQILKNGELFCGHRLILRGLAVAWAEDQRALIERGFDLDVLEN